MSAAVSSTSCSGSMRSKFVAVRGMAVCFRLGQLCFSALQYNAAVTNSAHLYDDAVELYLPLLDLYRSLQMHARIHLSLTGNPDL